MCQIASVLPGLDVPEQNLRNFVWSNPHGWGISCSKDGEILVFRGFGEDEAVAMWKETTAKYGETHHRVFHARASTAGQATMMNVHPFECHAPNGEKRVLFHNGCLSIPVLDNDHSDTWEFAQWVSLFDTTPALIKNIQKYALDEYSRFVLVLENGEVWRFGDGWINRDGVFYANNGGLTSGKFMPRSLGLNDSYFGSDEDSNEEINKLIDRINGRAFRGQKKYESKSSRKQRRWTKKQEKVKQLTGESTPFATLRYELTQRIVAMGYDSEDAVEFLDYQAPTMKDMWELEDLSFNDLEEEVTHYFSGELDEGEPITAHEDKLLRDALELLLDKEQVALALITLDERAKKEILAVYQNSDSDLSAASSIAEMIPPEVTMHVPYEDDMPLEEGALV